MSADSVLKAVLLCEGLPSRRRVYELIQMSVIYTLSADGLISRGEDNSISPDNLIRSVRELLVEKKRGNFVFCQDDECDLTVREKQPKTQAFSALVFCFVVL